MLIQFLAVGIGGFVGAILRFSLSKLMYNHLQSFPFATLFANVLAGFLIGVFFVLKTKANISPNLNLFLTTGLLGGA